MPSTSRFLNAGLLFSTLTAFVAGAGGAAAWNYGAGLYAASHAADLAAERDDAYQILRTDQAACTRALSAAADLCAALARYDRAALAITTWAQPEDRAPIGTVLATVRDQILQTEAPSWVTPLDWSREAALRRAKALESALKTLTDKGDQIDKKTMSGKLPSILKQQLLEDTNTP